MSKRNFVFAVVVAMLLLAVLSTLAPGQQPALERGRVLVERECARCHSVLRTGQSRHRSAPPFRDLSKKYPIESLAEALAEGIVVGHKDMPEFLFEPDDIQAILAYISSLGE
jgi:cytochrome c